jgi:hypothetical protein
MILSEAFPSYGEISSLYRLLSKKENYILYFLLNAQSLSALLEYSFLLLKALRIVFHFPRPFRLNLGE